MPADPDVGQTYRQEYYAGEAEDNGEVLALDGTAKVPAGSYDGLRADRRHQRAWSRTCSSTSSTRATSGVVLTIDVESGAREELLSVTKVSDAEARRAGRAQLGAAY